MGAKTTIKIECACARCGGKAYIKHHAVSADEAGNWVRDTLNDGVMCHGCGGTASRQQKKPSNQQSRKYVRVRQRDGLLRSVPARNITGYNDTVIADAEYGWERDGYPPEQLAAMLATLTDAAEQTKIAIDTARDNKTILRMDCNGIYVPEKNKRRSDINRMEG